MANNPIPFVLDGQRRQFNELANEAALNVLEVNDRKEPLFLRYGHMVGDGEYSRHPLNRPWPFDSWLRALDVLVDSLPTEPGFAATRITGLFRLSLLHVNVTYLMPDDRAPGVRPVTFSVHRKIIVQLAEKYGGGSQFHLREVTLKLWQVLQGWKDVDMSRKNIMLYAKLIWRTGWLPTFNINDLARTKPLPLTNKEQAILRNGLDIRLADSLEDRAPLCL